MKVFKIIIVACFCVLISSEEQKDAQDKTDIAPTQKIVLQKSEPYERSIEEPSFYSKLKNWIFPSSESTQVPDNKAVAGHHAIPQYVAPPRPIHPRRPDCNPCNKEPWVPIATNHGQNTLIGFVQHSELNNAIGGSLEHLKPPPDGPTQQYGVPNGQYGVPQEPRLNFDNVPSFDAHQGSSPSLPNQAYGSPHLTSNPNHGVSTQNFVLNPPPVPHHVPNQNYGPPPSQNYGPPPSQSYGPSPNQNYNPPPIYGPPKNQNYGPPPSPSYGPPITQNIGSSLVPPTRTQNYGPPPPNQNYGPPKPIYRAPHPQNIGPSKYGVPRPIPNKIYGPPKQNLPLIPRDHFSPPALYGPPKQQYGPPRFVQKPRPPAPNSGPPFHSPVGMRPPPLNGFVTNYGLPPTSQIVFANYGPPPQTFLTPVNALNLPSAAPSDSYGAPVTGPNVIYALSAQTEKEYLPPNNVGVESTQTIQLQEFDDILEVPNGPIPLPNLNQYPLAPLHGPQDFHKESDSQESRKTEVINGNRISPLIDEQKHEHQGISDVQIIPSIPVANFVSSVEYPINLIQSPLLDVSVSPLEASGNNDQRSQNNNEEHNQKFQGNSKEIQTQGYQNNNQEFQTEGYQTNSQEYQSTNQEYQANNNQGYDVNKQEYQINNQGFQEQPFKLSENPIFVEAHHDNFAAGTTQNVSFTNFKRDNAKDIVPSYSNEVTEILPNPNAINQLIEGRGINTVKPSYTQPALDYTNWTPSSTSTKLISTSILPPTSGPSTWLSTVGRGREILTTTQKSKQIQIIIPYTTNQTLKGRKVAPYSNGYENKLSLYTQPPTTESEWLKYTDYHESKKITTQKPEILNIKELLKKEKSKYEDSLFQYDALNFRKNIDDWTAQEYSNKNKNNEHQKATTISQLQHSKEIPKDFFVTKAYNYSKTTTPKYFFDHEPAGSNQNENKLTTLDEFENNFIITDTTLPSTTDEWTTTDVSDTTFEDTTEAFTKIWDSKNEVTSDKEKVYVVTPEPLRQTTTPLATVAFSLPPKVGSKTAKKVKEEYNNNLRLILSEWPHLINNLETTTTHRSTSAHPLFGLMDLSSYIPPANSTIQTYSGHSKVITIVTPISTSKSRNPESTTYSPVISS